MLIWIFAAIFCSASISADPKQQFASVLDRHLNGTLIADGMFEVEFGLTTPIPRKQRDQINVLIHQTELNRISNKWLFQLMNTLEMHRFWRHDADFRLKIRESAQRFANQLKLIVVTEECKLDGVNAFIDKALQADYLSVEMLHWMAKALNRAVKVHSRSASWFWRWWYGFTQYWNSFWRDFGYRFGGVVISAQRLQLSKDKELSDEYSANAMARFLWHYVKAVSWNIMVDGALIVLKTHQESAKCMQSLAKVLQQAQRVRPYRRYSQERKELKRRKH